MKRSQIRQAARREDARQGTDRRGTPGCECCARAAELGIREGDTISFDEWMYLLHGIRL